MHRWFAVLGLVCLTPLARGQAQGPLLLGDLNCTACHAADAGLAARILPHAAPSLAGAGRRLTPQYLRAVITDPQRAKAGGAMPHVMRDLAPGEWADDIESLTQYLVSLGGPAQLAPSDAASTALIGEGERLYHTVGCVACHAPSRPPPKSAEAEAAPTEIPKLANPSVPLGDLAGKTTLTALAAYLLDPLMVHASGRMPSMKLTGPEARALAAYLLRDQADRAKPAPVLGLAYALYDGRYDDKKGFDKLTPRQEGVLADVKAIEPAQEFTLRLTGQLAIDRPGKYMLTFAIRDQVKLNLDGKKVELRGGRRDKTMEAAVDLTAGQHPMELILSQRAGAAALESTWFRFDEEHAIPLPGITLPAFPISAWTPRGSVPVPTAARPIPAAAMTHVGAAMIPKGSAAFVADADKARQGKVLFASLRCANCHATGDSEAVAPDPKLALANLDPVKPGGCLDAKPAAGRPAYVLTDAQRADLRQTLAQLQKASQPPDDKAVTEGTIQAFNCVACHARAGSGAPDPGRLPYFTSTTLVDLGDEGRLAPHLNEVGAKLTTAAIERVLFEGATVRPYVATRMPQFGRATLAHLPAALAVADAGKVPPRTDPEPAFDPKLIDDGRRLVGAQGLGCVNCHGWGNLKSLGPPAVNLLAAPGRLTRGYVYAYLAEPAKYRPGTRMPAFWTDGQNAFKEVAGGDMNKQIEAIWAYLQLGERGGMPAGMTGSDQNLLVPTGEPILFRTFINGVGSHAIAVGFRQKTHVAFDAARVRMATAWAGDFLNAKGAWEGRAGEFTDVPSKEVVQLPAGPMLAVLESQTAAWPTLDAKARAPYEGWKFKGYRFAEDRTPTFLSRFNQIEVEETPSAQYAKGGHLTRRLHLAAPTATQNLYFRAAAGAKITANPDGSFTVDDKLQLRIKSAPTAPASKRTMADGKQELIVPIDWVPAKGGNGVEGNIEVELQW